jgi:hypothetical protein
MYLDIIYNNILILILCIILLLFLTIIVRPPKRDLNKDIYSILKEYKIYNIYYTFFAIFIYLGCNLFVFLYLRYLFLGEHVKIYLYIEKITSSFFILRIVFLIFTLSIGLYLIHILFYKELKKLHFLLMGTERYKSIVNRMSQHKYDSIIISLLTEPIRSFFFVISDANYRSIEDYYNFHIKYNYQIPKIKIKIQKILRYYLQKSFIFNYVFNFFYLSIFGFIVSKLPLWMRVLPEVLLISAILYDIKNHVLFLVFYMSFIYMIFINLRKLKEFYVETDPASDEFIYEYLYKGELLDNICYEIVKEYVQNNFKYWMMIDHPSRGLWHQLLIKRIIAEKYITLLVIPFFYVIFFDDSYTIFVPTLNLFIPCFILILPIILSKHIYETKIFTFHSDSFSQFASYNRYWYTFLWVLIFAQYFFFFILLFKNYFLLSATETIFNRFGIVITQHFTISDKAKFVLDYINLYLPTKNLLTPSIICFYNSQGIDLALNLDQIRFSIGQVYANYNLHLLNIDAHFIKENLPLPEIFIFFRNSLTILSFLGFLKFLVNQYYFFQVIYKINDNLPLVIFDTIKTFLKGI